MECLFVRRLEFQILVSGEATNLAIQLNFGRGFKRAGEKLHLRLVQHALVEVAKDFGEIAQRPDRHAANRWWKIRASGLAREKKCLGYFGAIGERAFDATGEPLCFRSQLFRFGFGARPVVVDPSGVPMFDLDEEHAARADGHEIQVVGLVQRRRGRSKASKDDPRDRVAEGVKGSLAFGLGGDLAGVYWFAEADDLYGHRSEPCCVEEFCVLSLGCSRAGGLA